MGVTVGAGVGVGVRVGRGRGVGAAVGSGVGVGVAVAAGTGVAVAAGIGAATGAGISVGRAVGGGVAVAASKTHPANNSRPSSITAGRARHTNLLTLTEPQLFLIQADITPAAADDDMVEQLNVQQFAGGDQFPGNGGILRAGRRVARGMIVYHYN